MRDVDAEDLNKAEAAYMYDYIYPQIKRMEEMGYEFPTVENLAWAASSRELF
jgi:hypothetical protein